MIGMPAPGQPRADLLYALLHKAAHKPLTDEEYFHAVTDLSELVKVYATAMERSPDEETRKEAQCMHRRAASERGRAFEGLEPPRYRESELSASYQPPQSEIFELRLFRQRCQQVLSPLMRDRVKFDRYQDAATGNLVLQAESMVWGEQTGRIHEETTILTPRTAWDLFKQELPGWIRKLLKVQVRYTTHRVTFDVDVWATYPKMREPKAPPSVVGMPVWRIASHVSARAADYTTPAR